MSRALWVDRETRYSYLQANYVVVDTKLNREYCLRLGEHSADINQMLARHNATTGLIFTAWNPHSRELSAVENRARNQKLRQDSVIANTGVKVYPSYGCDDQQTWREEGFFFTNIDCLQAQQLCLRYQQNAGVIVDTNHTAQLVWHPRVMLR